MDKAQAMKVMAESHRETVEELGQEINQLRDVIKGNKIIFDIASDELKILEKENKRYREELESILSYNHIELTIPQEVIDSIEKALEGGS